MRNIQLLFAGALIAIIPIELLAQRNVTYPELHQRASQSAVYLEHLVLPSREGGGLLSVNFRMDYELLPFIRYRPENSLYDDSGNDRAYFSSVRMSMEVIRGTLSGRNQSFEPVSRATWIDTAWAATYEQTRSRTEHVTGSLTAQLEQGEYNVILDLNRGESLREARSRERSITVPDYDNEDQGQLLLLRPTDDAGGQNQEIELLNFGEHVLYGEDFELLVLLPGTLDSDAVEVRIERLASGSDSRVTGDPLFTDRILLTDMDRTEGFSRAETETDARLRWSSSDTGFPLAILTIPNSEFPNTRMRISVIPEGSSDPVASRNISSRWVNMPVSLYNIDVSINMMRFIVNQDQIRELNRGNATERERKFRTFWSERDPTPDSEYNELMAEYYRRVDYAYENFSTPERPGFESDQGKAYINFGEPLRKERTYPADGPAREVWTYPNRTLVFEATSGFGDFRLISNF
ncbi:MAG: GWxTD domain-containing protein [Balneolaceae bacterium]